MGMSEQVQEALLNAGVWDLPAVLSAARALAVAELEIDRSESAISPGDPFSRRGRASQRHASLLITLEARA